MTRKFFQSFCKSIGDYACYLLCLIDIAEEYTKTSIDTFAALSLCVKKGYVKFNFDNYSDTDNFYVLYPEKILELLTGEKWSVRKENYNYKLADGEYGVEFWSATNGNNGHFARTYKGFNSLQKSNSVKNGKLYSWRVAKVVKG